MQISNTGVKVAGWDLIDQALQEDYLHCLSVMEGASKNYSFASRFLPPEKLPHVGALYAFLRVGDDRVDVSHSGFDSPLEAIEDWERSYWHAFGVGASPDPVLRAYLNTASQFEIPAQLMAPYFQAMKDDLTVTRFETFSDLLGYMEGSAMTVGRAMTHIMGIVPGLTMEEVLPQADALAIAMQLSNFWRDVGYDWSIGRVYIPQEDLRRFGVSEEDIASQRRSPEFAALIKFEIERTEQYYQKARLGVPMLASGRWGVLSALEIYRAINTSIRRRGYQVFGPRAGANKIEKTLLAAKAWWLMRG